MFNKFNYKEHCAFYSNPSISDIPSIIPKDENGIIKHSVEFVPRDLHSPLDGLQFQASIHSLRAKLNLGVPLSLVKSQNLDDFASAHNKLLNSEQKIYENANKRVAKRQVKTKNTTPPEE